MSDAPAGDAAEPVLGTHAATHRLRRGKLVEIPAQWRGQVTYRQTIRTRASKQTRKARTGHAWSPRASGGVRARQEARAPQASEWDA